MKKYIKSKGGKIYESKDLKIDELTGQLVKDNGKELEVIVVDEEADTIEGLFDEIDLKWKQSVHPFDTVRKPAGIGGFGDLKRFIQRMAILGHVLHKDYEVYGAVRIDKSLIYVAKLNEKGEWELL